jgi:hypothetical protein
LLPRAANRQFLCRAAILARLLEMLLYVSCFMQYDIWYYVSLKSKYNRNEVL